MKHIEGSFIGQGNLHLYYQGWLPAGAPRAVLLIVHGLAEHSGRYRNIASRFTKLGYAVYGLDQRGHAKSEGLRGYVERFSYYVDDLKSFANIVRRKHPEKKFFMHGHSMGALVAIAYATHHQNKLNGLIATGVSLKAGSGFSPLHIALARLLSRLTPKLGIAVIDASAISRDQAVVNAYINDPLVFRGKLSARLGAELIAVMQKLPAQLPKIDLPILIMHGTDDRLCNPEGSRILYQRVSSEDKTLKLYEGFYHEIFNEPGQEQVLKDMESWLTAHL